MCCKFDMYGQIWIYGVRMNLVEHLYCYPCKNNSTIHGNNETWQYSWLLHYTFIAHTGDTISVAPTISQVLISLMQSSKSLYTVHIG